MGRAFGHRHRVQQHLAGARQSDVPTGILHAFYRLLPLVLALEVPVQDNRSDACPDARGPRPCRDVKILGGDFRDSPLRASIRTTARQTNGARAAARCQR